MLQRIRLPSPAMTVALIALFIALAGSATAGVVVSFAQRSGLANNSKKLQNKTAAQVAAMPGPPNSVQSLISVRTSNVVINAGGFGTFQVSCSGAERVIAGGFSAAGGTVVPGDSYPISNSTWQMVLNNILGLTPANVTLYAVCTK
jgi:hypothetical protein